MQHSKEITQKTVSGEQRVELWKNSTKSKGIEASANIAGKMGSESYLSCPVSPRPPRRGGSPSFYRPRRGWCTSTPLYSATRGGMVYSSVEMTPVLASLAPVTASWRALYLNRGGFEGEGVVVDRVVSRQARGNRWRWSVRRTVAGVAASRPCVPNSARVVVAVHGVALQGRGWLHYNTLNSTVCLPLKLA
jgi:hypothetical protein